MGHKDTYEVKCPECGILRTKGYKDWWAIQKGISTARCLKCSRFKKGQTNSGGFKKGIVPWNKGNYSKCRACQKRVKNSKICRECWMAERKMKRKKFCLICKNTFYPKYSKTKFCSLKCFYESGVWIKTGEEHKFWKGEGAGKGAKHNWMSKYIKKPERCEHCKKKKKLEFAHKTHKYTREPNDYMALCRSCHRKYDIKYNNYKSKIIKT